VPDQVAHTTVDMDPNAAQIGTAIGQVPSACGALAASQVRLDGAAVTCSQALRVRTNLNDLDPKFMTEDAWVPDKRMGPMKCMDIGATNTNGTDTDQGFAGIDRIRFISLSQSESARFIENNGFQKEAPRGDTWSKRLCFKLQNGRGQLSFDFIYPVAEPTSSDGG